MLSMSICYLLIMVSYKSNQSKSHFPLGGIFLAERHFLLFKDQLAEGGRQKTKENMIARRKFRLVENGLEGATLMTFTGHLDLR